MSAPEFHCSICQQTFDRDPDRTDEIVEAEFERNFGSGHPDNEKMIVCSECHEQFWAWAERNAPELKRIKPEDLS